MGDETKGTSWTDDKVALDMSTAALWVTTGHLDRVGRCLRRGTLNEHQMKALLEGRGRQVDR